MAADPFTENDQSGCLIYKKMKFITFYFSGTGNTKWIAGQFDEMARAAGHRNSSYSVFEINSIAGYSDEILSADYIVLAFPLYGANIPRLMRSFISLMSGHLKQLRIANKKLIVVNNVGFVNGAGIFFMKKFIRNSPLEITIYLNIRTSNTAPSRKRNRAVVGDKLPEVVKARAKGQLEKAITMAAEGRVLIQGAGPHLLMGCLIRRLLRNEIRDNYRRMSVDMEVCTECMTCVKNCPTKSIQLKDKSFLFSSSCEACMRCYNNCPVHAISSQKQ